MDTPPPSQSIALIQWLAPLLSFAAVFVGAWLVRANDQRRQQLDFVEKQLRQLYSPLLSLRKEVRALSELRVRIQHISSATWREAVECVADKTLDYASYEQIIDYENEQLKTVLIPTYEKMLQTLRDNFYLASDTTRQQLPALVEYLELWHRFHGKTIPGEVLVRLGLTEEKLQPLYDDVESNFASLRQSLASARVLSLWSRLRGFHKM